MEPEHPTEIQRAGAKAYRDGVPLDQNPYSLESPQGQVDAFLWAQGWLDAAASIVRPLDR